MELIDKDAVVAEINKLKGKVDDSSSYCNGWQHALRTLEMKLNTLEVQEVDLDKTLTGFMGRYAYENGGEYPSAIDIAKHFFELGLKVNNDTVIEKACDWLKTNVTYTQPRTGETKCVVNLNAFINAMKGE